MVNIICPICGNTKTKLIINAPKLNLYCCQKCKIEFVPKKFFESKHTSDYFDEFSEIKYIDYYKNFRINTFKENWKIIQKLKQKGVALDFGASYGWFITSAPYNWKVVGIDQSKKVSKLARSKGINVLTGDEKLLEKKSISFDLITLHNVFEHLADPLYSLRVFKKSLKSGGILLIVIPNKSGLINRFSYFATKFKIYEPIYTLFQAKTPSPHYFYYSKQDITSLLKRAGFTTLFIKNQEIIDIKNYHKRLSLEENTNIFIKILMYIGVYITFYTSKLLQMPDEFAVYAKKTQKK